MMLDGSVHTTLILKVMLSVPVLLGGLLLSITIGSWSLVSVKHLFQLPVLLLQLPKNQFLLVNQDPVPLVLILATGRPGRGLKLLLLLLPVVVVVVGFILVWMLLLLLLLPPLVFVVSQHCGRGLRRR